ncbi:MAG: rhomboid family intramembrane serine protease [Gemmataceae bacterium]
MGINERDYYRKEGPSIFGSPEDQGKACTWLIGVTVGVFVVQMLTRAKTYDGWASGPFTEALLLDAPKVFRGEVWRLLTAAFLHSESGVYHILFNMLGLWWFGRQIEDRIGTREFLVLYLAAAAFSSAFYCVSYAAGFNGPRALGASGAVAAVLMLSALYFPQQIVYLMFVIPVPIWFIVVMMLATDGYALLARDPSNQVASAGHLGGLFFGFAYDRLGLKLTGLIRTGWLKPRPRLRLYAPETEESRRPSRINDEHLEAQMDVILEKVGRVGMNGLTDKERDLLMKASEAIRRREQ